MYELNNNVTVYVALAGEQQPRARQFGLYGKTVQGITWQQIKSFGL